MSNIHKSNIAKLDIGMISALEVLLRERSVGKAAMHAGLSQPAMSNALARMRAAFEDPLLVRGRKGMILTEHGVALLAQLTEILPRLDVLGRTARFDPTTSGLTFMLAATDHACMVVLPEILKRFSAEAPAATLKTTTVLSRHVDMTRLETTGFDLRIGWLENLPPDWHARTLFEEELVVIRRVDLSRRRQTPMDLRAFLSLKHVVLAPDQRSVRNLAEDALSSKGLKRTIGAFVSSFNAMPFIVAESDMIAVLPRRVAEKFKFLSTIQILPSPFRFQAFETSLAWHPRVHHDSASQWLRSLIVNASEHLSGI